MLQFSILNAQNNAFIGSVVDSSDGIGLVGAVVQIKNSNKVFSTNLSGEFKITGLRSGKYSCIVSLLGYGTKEITISLPSNNDSSKIFFLNPVVEDLETVVVTGTHSEMKLKETPVLTQVIYADKFLKTGITSVGPALECEVPGLNFDYSQNPLRPSISFQGMNAGYILMLIDGERIAGEKNGSIDFYMLNLTNVDRIEIVRGASSVLYGSNAIGGVINIITKHPVKPLEVNYNTRYSKYNELESSINISMKKKYFATSTDVIYNQSDGYDLDPKAFLTTYHTQEKYKNGNLFQRLEFYPTDQLTIIANSGIFYNRLFVGTSYRPSDSAYFDVNGYVKAIYQLKDSGNISLSYDADDYSNYTVFTQLNDWHRLSSYDYLQSTKLLANLKILSGTLSAGAEYLPERLFSNYLFQTVHTKEATELNVFGQFDYKFNSIFSANAGLRTTHHSSYGLHAVPKISFMANINPVILRLSYGYGYRSPTLKELYYYFDHFGMFTILGNPSLKPEESQYLGFSLEMNRKLFNHSVNFYYNRVSDMISDSWTVDSAGKKIDQYMNNASATIMGIDFMERIMPFKNFVVNGGLSLVNAKNNITGEQLYSISPISANISANYSFKLFKEKAAAEIYGKYNGYRNYPPIDTIPISDKPYYIWKGDVSYHIGNYITFAFGVDNIFNIINSKSFDNISPGRRYFFSLNIHLTKY